MYLSGCLYMCNTENILNWSLCVQECRVRTVMSLSIWADKCQKNISWSQGPPLEDSWVAPPMWVKFMLHSSRSKVLNMTKPAKTGSQETLNFGMIFDEYLAFRNLSFFNFKIWIKQQGCLRIMDTKSSWVSLSAEMWTHISLFTSSHTPGQHSRSNFLYCP